MERLAEQPIKIETEKSFDPLASVDMYRFDLEQFGRILPETRQRVFDEELSYVAEGINRPLRTEFVLQNVDGQLSFFDRGEWQPYIATLLRGLEVAKQEAATDFRKSFLVDRAETDLQRGYDFLSLEPGEQITWYSPFPEEAGSQFGDEFVKELGFWPARKMGFLYLATKDEHGRVTLQTQSVDNSDENAFTAAMLVGNMPGATLDMVCAAYDRALEYKHQRPFYAGRDTVNEIRQENAWDAVMRHKDLLEFYFDEIEALAGDNSYSQTELERAKKRLTYGVWAALKLRLDQEQTVVREKPQTMIPQSREVTMQEVHDAYNVLATRGEIMPGCGGGIRSEADLLSADSSEVFDSIFGKGESKDSWEWKTGVCRVNGCPTRPSKTKVGPCEVCTTCQHLFDKGKDPVAEYRLRRAKAAYN